ncbi:hypothetical protein DERP_011839 [Dermatophagoides pteronyssinus]|uniref:Uncharacterized protein n=1 Tax=Dermatophagoides pteronyssinus TaxID=6956 RepID=A0ABQ8JS47_DERPT|nr:hypothetical protein DERP_011839 [Dermatophagoides pteronyssinus]
MHVSPLVVQQHNVRVTNKDITTRTRTSNLYRFPNYWKNIYPKKNFRWGVSGGGGGGDDNSEDVFFWARKFSGIKTKQNL